ncbi:MAG: hypothetical protein ABIB43_00470 [archaeon]
MSNEELLSDLRFNTEYKLHKKRKDVEIELLARNPMSENCGNCEWRDGSVFLLCVNEKSTMDGKSVNKTIRCSFWRGGEK